MVSAGWIQWCERPWFFEGPESLSFGQQPWGLPTDSPAPLWRWNATPALIRADLLETPPLRVEFDRLFPALPVSPAARLDNRACTSRRYRARAGCHLRPRGHRWDENRDCRKPENQCPSIGMCRQKPPGCAVEFCAD